MHNKTRFTGVEKRREHLRDLNAKVNGSVDDFAEKAERHWKVKARVGSIIGVPRSISLVRHGQRVMVRIFNITKAMYSYAYYTDKKDGPRVLHSGTIGFQSGTVPFEQTVCFID